MKARKLLGLLVLMAALGVAAGCGSDDSSNTGDTGATGGTPGVKQGGLLRIGTTSNYDSINPFVAFSAQSYITFTNIYPTLVQYDNDLQFEGDWAEDWTTSDDGLTWTFNLKPGGTWSDGTPLTAQDAVWTGETILQYKDGPTAALAPFLSHVASFEAPDDNTLVMTYEKPVGNVLPQLQQFFILPQHVWEQHVGGDGKELKRWDPASELPIVSAGSFELTQYEKKGTTILEKNEGFYGQDPNVDAIGIVYYDNDDAMLAALQSGEIDYMDSVPSLAIDQLRNDSNVTIYEYPGFQVNNIIFNSNPKKDNQTELLDPKVKEALAHAVDRETIAETVFGGYATPIANIVTPLSGDLYNPLEPEAYDLDLANQMLDDLGYAKGSDGVRTTPDGEKMAYDVIIPEGVEGVDRSFEIVRDSFKQVGVALTPQVFDDTTAFEKIGEPNWEYTKFDMSMWNWVGYPDPDFVLSVVTCGQYGGWSDTGYCDPAYDEMYKAQGVAVDAQERKDIVWEMQQKLYDERPYIQLVQLDLVTASNKNWTGFKANTSGLSKHEWIEVGQVG